MEEWYKKVRLFKDESEAPYVTEKVCHKMFYDLKRSKIREKGKFKNRMGPEFESWVESLNQRFDQYPQLINSILSDDDFWNATLKLTLNI
jgi:hypothetical protein